MTTTLSRERTDSCVVAHAILTLVGEDPGRHGRQRCARIVAGRPTPGQDRAAPRFAPDIDGWSLNLLVELVDALLAGRLMVLTLGARPTLALTRAGHHALDALDNEQRQGGHS